MINLIDHIKLPFRKDKELYSSLYRILGFYPHHIALYRQALAHSSSAIRSKNGKKINNERLEFLGDAIIEAVTSDIVFHHFEQKREGFLTTTRSKLVQRNTLNRLAEEVGLDKLVRAYTRPQQLHKRQRLRSTRRRHIPRPRIQVLHVVPAPQDNRRAPQPRQGGQQGGELQEQTARMGTEEQAANRLCPRNPAAEKRRAADVPLRSDNRHRMRERKRILQERKPAKGRTRSAPPPAPRKRTPERGVEVERKAHGH